VYPPHLVEWAFRAHHRKGVCCECRGKQKRRNPWPVKANDVTRRHADRFGIDKNDLVTVFGWDPQQLARDAERQYAIGCSYCGEEYTSPADITLDIMDPKRPPYYLTNTKWCCQKCNRDKGAMSPEAFEAKIQIKKLWNLAKNQPPEQGTLFEAG
jgi:hypothetical protein